MDTLQKGFIAPILIILLIIVVGGGAYIIGKNKHQEQNNNRTYVPEQGSIGGDIKQGTVTPSQSEPTTVQPQSVDVAVYFRNNVLSSDPNDCRMLLSVTRQVPYASSDNDLAIAAVNELIAGPNQTEISDGYFSVIPVSSTLNSLDITNGIAHVDVSRNFFETGGSCGLATATVGLRETIMQFSSIQDVEITIDGLSVEAALEGAI